MLRALVLGTVLLAGSFLSMSWTQNSWTQSSWTQSSWIQSSWAQDKTEPLRTGPPFPFSKTTFQWDYSCPGGKVCSFICPGGGASHVIKLRMYLGTIPVGSQDAPAVIYDFSTIEIPHARGFSVSVGLGTLSCQVNGMTSDYSGPPKESPVKNP